MDGYEWTGHGIFIKQTWHIDQGGCQIALIDYYFSVFLGERCIGLAH
jgi:hypothetical protein